MEASSDILTKCLTDYSIKHAELAVWLTNYPRSTNSNVTPGEGVTSVSIQNNPGRTGQGKSVDSVSFEESFCVDRSHAAGACCGDCLPVVRVGDVAGREDPGDVRAS